jgi:hypothetical protein
MVVACFKLTALMLYRENFNWVDESMVPRFAATGALHAAGRMRVLPKTQHT